MKSPRGLGIGLVIVAFLVATVLGAGAPPTFTNILADGSTRTSINENSGTGNSVFDITENDPEGDATTLSMTTTGEPFSLSSQQVQVSGALDFETKQFYILVFEVTDGTGTSTATLNVDINDLNDESPSHTGALTANFNEEQAAGTTVPFTFSFTDPDAGDTLTYALTGTHATYFSIVPATGAITSNQLFDREAPSAILLFNQLTLTVTDAAGNNDIQTLAVTLVDINDNTPTCTQTAYFGTVTENDGVDTSVATLVCSDTDASPNGDITLTIDSGDDATPKFKVVGQEIHTTATVTDFETKSSYTLVIHATDGGGTPNIGTSTVIVTVLPQNEYDPVWGASVPVAPYSVPEDSNIGTSVVTVVATDADIGADGAVTYSIVSTTGAVTGSLTGIFQMDGSSGVLSTMSTLDRESETSYDVVVRATDGGTPTPRSVDMTLTIGVGDVNDNTPTCTQATYYGTVTENDGVDTSVATLVCSDLDASPNGDITLTINSGDDATPKFKVVGQEIHTTATVTDYEVKVSYTLVIHITDGGATPNVGTSTVVVTVLPQNENDPVWGASVPVAPHSVPEDSNSGTSVVTVVATDADIGADGAVTYSIVSTTGAVTGLQTGIFEIDGSSGVLSTMTTLDRESETSYDVVVRATDGGTPTPRSVDMTLTISVGDVNDNTPTCTQATYYGSVTENDGVDTSVATLVCSDLDASPNGDITLTINSGDDATPKFKVVGQEIRTTATVTDYETKQSYTLVIHITDGGATPNVGTSTLVVTVLPQNENDPAWGASVPVAPHSVPENSNSGTSVVTVVATDADIGADGAVTYSIVSTTGAGTGLQTGIFEIDGSSGVLSTMTTLDRESETSFDVVVRATDGGTPTPRSVDMTLTISVGDVNDNTPTCTQATYYGTVTENDAVDTSVATLVCSDLDASPNGDITLTINSGDDATPKFKVVGQEIHTTATVTDFETKSSYTLVIHATDGGGTPNVGTSTVVVTVLPQNENDPVWGTFVPVAPYSVSENANVGTSVVTVVATDADTGADGDVTYSIVTTTGAVTGSVTGIFQIDGSSGLLSTLSALDRESETSYDVVVRASDGGTPTPRSADVTLTINVDDYNDNAPVFTGSPYSKIFTEATATATANVVTVAYTDADATSTPSYVIEQGDTAKFEFSGAALQLKTAINIDSPDNHPIYYELRVIVKDGGTPELTGTTTVTVQITPANEHDPVFSAGFPSTVTPPESSPLGYVVETMAATDLDYGTDGQITFAIKSGDPNGDFSIDPTTGVVSIIKTLDFEATPTYTLKVSATDGGSRSAETDVTVNVGDVNDNFPSCTPNVVSVTMNENEPTSYTVASLTCSDADAGDTLSYNIISGNGDGKFALNSGTGVITLAATVDYDSATTSYQLGIQVNDGTNIRTVTVYIGLNPINEATPAFPATFPSASVSESDPAGTVVYTYLATDTDYAPHGISQYAITTVTQSGAPLFTIDPNTAVITLTSPLDYDTLPAGTKFYLLTVEATDGGGLVGTGTVTVDVTNTNDNAPSCSASSWTVNVGEDTASFPTTIIPSLGCSDVEDGTTLTYAMTQTPGSHFAVASNAVTITSTIDYESNTGHTLTITVSDTSVPVQSTIIIVNVIVDNVNDGPPTFTGTFSQPLAENVGPGQSVHDVIATDPDGTNEFGNPVYSIISGDLANQFAIDSNSGRVSTIAALDRETTSSYELVIRAKESSSTGFGTATLTITVTDVNDTPPSCSPSSFLVTVSESEAANFVVSTFTCTDADTTGTLTYTLSSGDGTKFETNSNNLRLKAPLDFDSGVIKYDVIVTVSDSINTISIPGTINVGNVNEFPPVFSLTVYPAPQSESLAVGSTVATVVATDADSAATQDGQVSYAFVTSYSQFNVNSASGAITLVSALDRETSATHDLLVTATDGATIVTATVSVTVTDENDNAPVFGAGPLSGVVSESDAAGASVVATVVATDADDPGTNGNGQITFSIIGGNTNSDFTINGNNGQITTVNQLNYEVTQSYSLIIKAVDRSGDASSRSSTTIVGVSVTNVNEFDPVFSPTTISKNVAETTNVGDPIHNIAATDADAGVDGTLTYSMPTHAKFALAPNGALTLKASVNFETGNSYTLTVTATDGGTPARSADVTVNIAITDVNDNTPSCTAVAPASYREDATGTIASLSCSDPDTGASGTLYYTIVSVNAVAGTGPFAISGSGVVTIATNLDYETDTAHSLIIRVEDGAVPALSTTVTVNIAVSDLNEAAPAFGGTPFNPSFSESESIGYTVLTVAATDADTADTITYSLSDTTNLQIGPSSGVITLKVKQDRETSASFSLNVCATDSGTVTAVKQTCETLTVTITDANDNLPVFSPALYTGSVDENEAVGQTVTTVTATDDDAAPFGTVAYSIFAGNTGNVFRVDAAAGHIVVDNNANLDYETITQFTLTVRATDGGGQTTDVSVPISVNPINEITPTFTPASSTENVPENSAVGFVVIDLNAVDSDSGADGSVTYSIVSGAGGKFAVDPATGEVKVSDVLNAEAVASYVITIQATDAGTTPSALSGTYILTATLTDINDETPSCTSSYYSTSISESATPATSVQQLVCSDADVSAPNNALSYSKTGGDPGNLFDVDSSSGLVDVAAGASFDRETTASYLVDITVSDGGGGPLSTVIQVFVSITDTNDNIPTFTLNSYPATIGEDITGGTIVTTVVATDTDSGVNGQITYSISSGNGLSHYVLDSATGVLSVQAGLDREAQNAYQLEVLATDKGSPTALIGTSTVTITVTDVNDNAPVCGSSVYTGSAAEDAIVTFSVSNVACTDNDIAPNNNVQYTITGGNTGNAFAIGTTSGDVTVNAALDAENKSLYSLTVEASDGTLTTTVLVSVTITDVNDETPVFSPAGPYTNPFSEATAVGTVIRDIDATDADVSNPTLTYTITAGNGDNKFYIDPATGAVSLVAALDRETTTTYTLTVDVADGTGAGSRTAQTSLTVNVLDENDNNPSCTPAVYANNLPEDSTTGTVVSSPTCSDPDSSTPTLAYSIASGNTASKFTIDAASGVVTVANTLDYETTKSYSLVVSVSDQGTPANVITIPVNVDVGKVNEHPPVFAPVTPVNIPESTAIGSTIFTVAASDADDGVPDGTVRYSITNGDSLGQFSIDEGTGEIKVVAGLDRESIQSYSLTIQAADDVAGSANERTDTVVLTVNIDDVNDNVPTFVPALYTANVVESAPSGSTIIQVTSRDDDSAPNATPVYSIVSGNIGSVFTFVADELLLDTGKTLDFETLQTYDLVIQVSDSGTPLLTSNGRIIISVQSVNEFPPVPAVANDVVNMTESTPVGTNFYNATASDADVGAAGSFTWSIISGNSPAVFFCSPQQGELYVTSYLDYDVAPNTYNITVQAQDTGGLTGSFWLAINLLDINDEYPVFTQSLYTPTFNENTATGQAVTTVVANDKDSGLNGQVTYTITSGDGQSFFAIDGTTGAITNTQPIDYETKTVYFLILQAADGGSPSLSTVGAVRITIVDINDNPPVFTPADFSQTVSEDVVPTTGVTKVSATDADSSASNNNVFTYSLTDAFFQVNAGTGDISTKATLDRETNASHILTIYATDQGTPPLTGTATVTINLIDVNDNDPQITGTYTTNLPEDTNTGTIIFTITATDPDAGVNAELEYIIASGNTDTDFNIEAGSGIITIGKTLDRERTDLYNLVIHVVDKGTTRRTASVTTTIVIDDINDNNPIFVTNPYGFNIAENVPIGSTVGVVQATDQDTLVNAALIYEVAIYWTGVSTHFALNLSSGEITTITTIDRETISSYSFLCRAKDGGSPQLTGSVNVTVSIDDLNDNAPVFTPAFQTVGSVVENTAVAVSILKVTVSDADEHNGALTLTIDTSTPQGIRGDTFLAIDPAGILSVKAVMDRETDADFNITVIAVDNGTLANTASTIVYITVIDQNDNVPTFVSTFYNTEVSYTASCDNTIVTLSATDLDSGSNGQLTYTFSDNPHGFVFDLNATSGVLMLTTPLSANTKYVLKAIATDAGTPQLTSNPVASVRVDTFDPNIIAVTVKLGISKADFLLKQTQFVTQFQAVLSATYPTCVVRVWCITERTGEIAITPTARRRLLASSPVDVNLVVLSDDTTESIANLDKTKTFLTSSEVTSIVTSDTTGTPGSSLTGTAWDYYAIDKVTPYSESVTLWHQTTVGIIFIVLGCLLGLLFIIITIVLIILWRKKKRPVTPTKGEVAEPRPRQNNLIVSKAVVPDLDIKALKKHPPPAVLALPLPSKKVPPRVETYEDDDIDLPRPPSQQELYGEDRKRSITSPPRSAPRTPRSIIIQARTDGDGFFVKNRHFDGTAVDPTTGKVYEYNTKTNERRWLTSRDSSIDPFQ